MVQADQCVQGRVDGAADLCFLCYAEQVWPLMLVHLCVLLWSVHGAKSLHVLLDVLLRLVLHIFITLKVLWILARF